MSEPHVKPKPNRARTAKEPSSKPAPEKPSRTSRGPKLAAAPANEARHRHPNVGLPPIDMTAGFPADAAGLRRDKAAIASAALKMAAERGLEYGDRFGEESMRQWEADAEVLVERLADCVASDDAIRMKEYAEWIGPQFRRRHVSLWDVAAVCAAIRDVTAPRVGEGPSASIARAMDAGIEVLRKNGRLGGDTHKRNALLKWFYRGV